MHLNARATLLGIIATHGLAGTFSLRLIHKHFTIFPGQIMVYDKIEYTVDKNPFLLCSPRTLQPDAGGLHFKAAPGGDMIAYELTREPGADLSAHKDFVAEFASKTPELGVQDVFALTALAIRPQDAFVTEFEVCHHVQSKVLVFVIGLLMAHNVQGSTSTCTDWIATAGYDDLALSINQSITTSRCNSKSSAVRYRIIFPTNPRRAIPASS